MAETTNISWADATLNFWIGCTKVSPACDNCYAETWGNRFGVKWGPHEERRITTAWESKIRAILRDAAKKGIAHPFVFVNSLSDFWDNAVSNYKRAAAIALMRKYPQVTFLLLTKRPGNILKMARAMCEDEIGSYVDTDTGLASWWPRNLAIGCTVVNQDEANSEVPKLLAAKAALKPAFAFLSMEPLLSPIDFSRIPWRFNAFAVDAPGAPVKTVHALTGEVTSWDRAFSVEPGERAPTIDWAIVGGESGVNARPLNPAWVQDIEIQCDEAGVPFHFKQWGAWVNINPTSIREANDNTRFRLVSPGVFMKKVGAKAAGRTLGGKIHDARPKVAA